LQSDKLINHSPDLKRLWDEGYEIEISEGFLLIHHVPYLTSAQEIKFGVIITALSLAGDIAQKPADHTVYFAGETPCDKNGQALEAIINSAQNAQLTSKIQGNFYLSSKPQEGYSDYYDKITTYANLISASAKSVSVDDTVTEKTFRVVESSSLESVFQYEDTNSSRAKINHLSQKVANLKVAIIGLGGTGGYILDLVAKTRVEEIHLFDGDFLKSHNAFRAPGAVSIEKLRERLKKTDYFKEMYSSMHRKIFSHSYFVETSNIGELSEMNFVFLSLDDGEAKKIIIDYLREENIPFTDSGMGLENVNDELHGIVRITTFTERKSDHLDNRISFVQEVENDYNDNIQIADLNSLNASMAVIKWKKLFGFYHDSKKENHSEYTIEFNLLTSEDYDS
jgi:hypothetical protein